MQHDRNEIVRYLEEAFSDALERARAFIEELDRDESAPRRPVAVRPEELEALRRHFRLTATLRPRLSNLDHPGWRSAHAQYERSRENLTRAVEGGARRP